MEGGVYGGAAAGAAFNPIEFFKRPSTILRLVSMFFSLIVFSCIASGGRFEGTCLYNGDSNACNYGIGIGVLAFLACGVFLVADVMFERLSNVNHRKYVVMADLGFSAFWAFLWFVGFCYLTDKWRANKVDVPSDSTFKSNCQAAIAFSFFSIGTWAALSVFAFLRYRQGSTDAFAPAYEQQGDPQPSAYPGGYPGEGGDPYQQPPFSGGPGTDEKMPEYQPPTY